MFAQNIYYECFLEMPNIKLFYLDNDFLTTTSGMVGGKFWNTQMSKDIWDGQIKLFKVIEHRHAWKETFSPVTE